MFTGIIEDLGKIISLKKEKANLQITVQSKITSELRLSKKH